MEKKTEQEQENEHRSKSEKEIKKDQDKKWMKGWRLHFPPLIYTSSPHLKKGVYKILYQKTHVCIPYLFG